MGHLSVLNSLCVAVWISFFAKWWRVSHFQAELNLNIIKLNRVLYKVSFNLPSLEYTHNLYYIKLLVVTPTMVTLRRECCNGLIPNVQSLPKPGGHYKVAASLSLAIFWIRHFIVSLVYTAYIVSPFERWGRQFCVTQDWGLTIIRVQAFVTVEKCCFCRHLWCKIVTMVRLSQWQDYHSGG